MNKTDDWKGNLGFIYSTNPNFLQTDEKNEQISVSPAKMLLRIELCKRNGKFVTLVSDFKGMNSELKELAKILRIKCSAGGSQRDGEILIQGDLREKIAEILTDLGYKIKKIGF